VPFLLYLLRLLPPISTLFPYTTLFRSHTYEITLQFSEDLQDSGLSVIVTPAGYYEENTFYVNGEESENRLSMNAHTYFNLFLQRSEEHTSELQSRFDLVCRLLLEKKIS